MALNKEQEDCLALIRTGRSIFLTGPGGTGKSYLIQQIVQDIKSRDRKVAVTALTGCAALLLGSEAKTIHSWAGVGLGRDPAVKIASEIRKWKYKVLRRWLLTHTLIIDEISMMTPDLLELLDEVARLVRREDRPFGGLQVILVGDFFQLPPVIKQDEEDKSKPPPRQFAFECDLWYKLGLQPVVLKQVMRQADPTFQEILSQVRWGNISDKSFKILEARQTAEWQDLKIKPTLLFSRRAEVEMINERNLSALEGLPRKYAVKTVFDVTLPKGLTEQSPDVKRAILKLDRDAPYKTSLDLKVGAQVMLTYNLDQESGLVNGSRGVVEGFQTDFPHYPMVLFKGKAAPIAIGPQSWESEEIEGLKRQQIPLILAYAVTIHKVQGATLDSALIDIGQSTFEVGQAYVALSRVKSLDSLYIYDLDPLAIRAHPKVKQFYETLA